MKKKLLHSVLAALLSVALIICFSNLAFSQEEKSDSKAMKGLSVIPSFYGPGIGLRSWSSPQIGWGAEIQPSWEFNDFTARVRFMYTLSTGKKARWYGLLTAGYMAVNEEYSGYGMTMDYSVSMPTFAIGIGWEKLLGFKKNKGLAFEAGYQIGSADYDIEMEMYGTTTTLSQTYKASPLYLGGSYTFYFKK